MELFTLKFVSQSRIARILKIQCVLLFVASMALTANNKSTDVTINETQQMRQNETSISGQVLDSTGEPIIGAVVVEKGTTNGTATDANGKFAIKANSGSVLVVSYIGYISQEIKIGSVTNLNITLELDERMLDEVVVVGYGTMKKKDLTGAVASIKGDDLATRKTTQLSTALQGATSGVLVTRDGGSPGATANIKIRGVTTIGETSPLFIIDGVPGDLNQVNPEDVESITVLKDAASASIYGSRAAAGVIVVTTKRASSTSLNMNYSFNYGWEMPTQLPEYVSATRYMEMTNEMRYNDNKAGGWNQTYSEDQIINWEANNLTDPDKYPLVDWQKLLLRTSAPRMTHSVTVGGGNKNVRTQASFRYDKTEGLYAVKNSYERYLLRVNNDFEINKYLKAHADVSLKRSESKSPNAGPFASLNTPPIYADKWSNGLWGDVKDGGNILAGMTDGGSKKNTYTNVAAKAGIDILPFEGLKISAVVAPKLNFAKGKTFRKKVPFTYADDSQTVRGYVSGFRTTMLTEQRDDDYDVTSQLFANYGKTIGKHDFTAMVGYEDYHSNWEYLGASRDLYELENFPYLSVGPQSQRDNSGSGTKYAYQSYFGRLTYSYGNRYLLQANLRRDGSSRFAKEHRWGNFPSFSGGWVVSEESFIKEMKMDWLSYFKLRGSWGKLGNERISGYFPYQSFIDFGTALLNDGNKIESVTTAAQYDYAVNDITWETTATWDIGLDMNFLNNKLRLTADYYRKNTKDMLLPLEIPKYIGYGNPSVNAGKMHTKGYDIEVFWNDNINDFNYSIAANFSDSRSVMGDLQGTEFLGDQIKKQGSQFNEWYGYLSDGLYLTQEDLDNSPKVNANTSIGDIKYKDISGPDGVPDGVISPEYDRVFLGGSLPRYMFGLTLNAAYKGFDLSMMFQGIGSQKTRLTANMIEAYRDNWKNFPAILNNNYWSEKNTDEQNANAKYPRLTMTNKSTNLRMSDYWMFNGRYLRMKNLTIGYTLPSNLTKKASINKLRVYLSANDIFCWNSYPKGWDPESTGYPITTSVLLGLSLDF